MTRLASILAGLALSLFAGPATAGTENRFFGVVQGARLDDRDLKTLSETGVGSVRFLLNWPSVEPSPGSYEWAATDELVGGLAAHGIQPLPFVYGSPSWVAARSIRPPTGSPAARSAWRAFLQATVERYGPGGSYWTEGPLPLLSPYHLQFGLTAPVIPVTTWQLWNEPNLRRYFAAKPAVAEYARLLRISHAAIKDRDPNAAIVLAGMPGYGDPDAWDFLERFYRRRGIKRDFDAVALHPYARTVTQLGDEVERLRAVMDEHGDRGTPLWLTELGWGSAPPDSFGINKGIRGQRKLLSRSFKLILRSRRRWNVERVLWFDWRDPAEHSNEAGTCSFCRAAGLLEHDYDRKPAYHAFRRFTEGG